MSRLDLIRRHVFLVDGLGAMVTAAATAGLAFAPMSWVGVPRATLMKLVGLACVYAVYSLGCWVECVRLVPWLPVVMVANAAYAGLGMAVVVIHFDTMGALGLAYFLGEVVVLIGVVAFEAWVLRHARSSR